MKARQIQQYKKIKNSPIRSPSPDYSPRARNTGNYSPIRASQLHMRRQPVSPITSFPNLPLNLNHKHLNKQSENLDPSKQKGQLLPGSTAATKNQEHKHANSQIKTSQFETQATVEQIFQNIDKIYTMLTNHNGKSKLDKQLTQQKAQIQVKYLHKIVYIKQEIVKMLKINQDPSNDKKLKHYDSFGNYDGQILKGSGVRPNHLISSSQNSIIGSPIANNNAKFLSDDDSLSLLQNADLINENYKLKRQVSFLQLEIQRINSKTKHFKEHQGKNDIVLNQYIPNSRIVEESIEQDSSLSSTAQQFMREKITYLQNQLQNKISKLIIIQSQKDEEIRLLKDRLAQKNSVTQNQLNNYRKLIQTQRTKIHALEQEDQNPMDAKSKRARLASYDEKIHNKEQLPDPPLAINRQRKALSWDKEQILSIYDQDHQPDQSAYSQAERVDLQQLFSIKKELSVKIDRVKDHYEQIITETINKYHNEMTSLQEQLRELRLCLEQCVDDQSSHKQCSNCLCNLKLMKTKQIQLLELNKQINILKEQVIQEKKQNDKLRILIQKAFNHELAQKTQRKIKPKIENSKKSVKSNQSEKRRKQSQIQSQQSSENLRGAEQTKQSIIYESVEK